MSFRVDLEFPAIWIMLTVPLLLLLRLPLLRQVPHICQLWEVQASFLVELESQAMSMPLELDLLNFRELEYPAI